MPNRRYTDFSDIKIGAETARRSGEMAGKGNAPFSESKASWSGAPGPKGPRRNTLPGMFKEVKQYPSQDMADDKGLRVSKKISHLKDEGKSQKQAVAIALNMEKEGRLTKSGGYRRKRK